MDWKYIIKKWFSKCEGILEDSPARPSLACENSKLVQQFMAPAPER